MLNSEIAVCKMVVYKIEHKTDGKVYIGQTTRTLGERISEHLRKGHKYYIDNALKKDGIDAFEISILETCETADELYEREKFWIKYFNSKAPNGYNLTDGGEGTAGRIVSAETRKKQSDSRKGRKFSPLSKEHREKISRANKGRKRSEEYCRRFSEMQRGKKRKPHSEETRHKMSKKCKGKRPVRCVETNEIFESITEAAKWAGVTFSTLSIAVDKNNRTAGGYHWEFVN